MSRARPSTWLPARPADGSASCPRQYGLTIDPDELVADLGVGEKQRVEILKVLYRGAQILILDEPTAVLVPQEVEELFTSLRQLTADGATVIFISHQLDEVLAHADAITVIRAGKTVGEIADPSSVTAEQLAELMVGSELPTPETRARTVTDRVRLELVDLTVEPDAKVGAITLGPGADTNATETMAAAQAGRRPLDGVSIKVHGGEIVGIAGVEGNGQTELIDAIMGLLPASGDVLVDGAPITGLGTLARREAGLGYIPEDRQRDGMVLGCRCGRTCSSATRTDPTFDRRGFIDRDAARQTGRGVWSPTSTCAPPASTCAPPRCRAATSRSSSSGGRCWPSPPCSSPPTRPAASTSVPRRRSGTCCATPATRARPRCSCRPTSRS